MSECFEIGFYSYSILSRKLGQILKTIDWAYILYLILWGITYIEYTQVYMYNTKPILAIITCTYTYTCTCICTDINTFHDDILCVIIKRKKEKNKLAVWILDLGLNP